MIYTIPPLLKSVCQPAPDKWFTYSQLSVICSHTLQPRGGKKKMWRASEKKDNELKSLCSSVFLWGSQAEEKQSQMRARTAHTAREMASVEWQRAKWAWPLRRGNSITVCQSWNTARDRLLVHFKKELKVKHSRTGSCDKREVGIRHLRHPQKAQ